jgi:hypothetical protein
MCKLKDVGFQEKNNYLLFDRTFLNLLFLRNVWSPCEYNLNLITGKIDSCQKVRLVI